MLPVEVARSFLTPGAIPVLVRPAHSAGFIFQAWQTVREKSRLFDPVLAAAGRFSQTMMAE
jgi:hypothetical protein